VREAVGFTQLRWPPAEGRAAAYRTWRRIRATGCSRAAVRHAGCYRPTTLPRICLSGTGTARKSVWRISQRQPACSSRSSYFSAVHSGPGAGKAGPGRA